MGLWKETKRLECRWYIVPIWYFIQILIYPTLYTLRYLVLQTWYQYPSQISKGTVSRDFWCRFFFHLTASPGPNRDVLGRFLFLLHFGWVISVWRWLRGACNTAESFYSFIQPKSNSYRLKVNIWSKNCIKTINTYLYYYNFLML